MCPKPFIIIIITEFESEALGIARSGTWLAGVGKEVSFETAFERANGW